MKTKTPVAELANLAGKKRYEQLIKGAEAEGRVIFYTSTAPEDIQSLLLAFGMRYPFIRPEMVRDKGTVLRERIIQEYHDGGSAADVIELTEINLGKLKEKGLLCPYSSPEARAYPAELQESEGYWIAEQKNFLVLAWNTVLLESAFVPSEYHELLAPQLKGKITIESHDACWMTALMSHWGEKKGTEFFSSFGLQIGNLLPGHQIIAERIAAGSAALSPTIHSNNSEWLKRRNLQIDWRPLQPVVAELVGAALSAKPQHPHAALLLIDFILSEEGQKIFRLWKRVPCHPAVDPNPPYMSQGFNSVLVNAKAFLQRESEYEKLWQDFIVEPASRLAKKQ